MGIVDRHYQSIALTAFSNYRIVLIHNTIPFSTCATHYLESSFCFGKSISLQSLSVSLFSLIGKVFGVVFEPIVSKCCCWLRFFDGTLRSTYLICVHHCLKKMTAKGGKSNSRHWNSHTFRKKSSEKKKNAGDKWKHSFQSIFER